GNRQVWSIWIIALDRQRPRKTLRRSGSKPHRQNYTLSRRYRNRRLRFVEYREWSSRVCYVRHHKIGTAGVRNRQRLGRRSGGAYSTEVQGGRVWDDNRKHWHWRLGRRIPCHIRRIGVAEVVKREDSVEIGCVRREAGVAQRRNG